MDKTLISKYSEMLNTCNPSLISNYNTSFKIMFQEYQNINNYINNCYHIRKANKKHCEIFYKENNNNKECR